MRTKLVSMCLALALAACSGGDAEPTQTHVACPTPDPTTIGYSTQYDPGCTTVNGSGACFGENFMNTYCTMCHSNKLKVSQRNGAPILHDFNFLEGVLEVENHVDEYAAAGSAVTNTLMPGERCPTTPGGPLDRDCPQPTLEERQEAGVWLACAVQRNDAGVYDFRPDGGSADDGSDSAGSDAGVIDAP